jgi:cell division protein FtsB
MARNPSRLRLLVWIVVGALALAFAVEGGEYGTRDLLRQRTQKRRLTREIDSVTGVVDSLKRYEARLEHDPRLQERIAREVFGMVRDGELLYRFYDAKPDSSKK